MKDKNLEQNLDKWILSSEEINFIKTNNTEIDVTYGSGKGSQMWYVQ